MLRDEYANIPPPECDAVRAVHPVSGIKYINALPAVSPVIPQRLLLQMQTAETT